MLVLAYMTDSKSGVANATLYYRIDNQEVVRLKMNRTGNLYFAEIPPKRYNSAVTYVVCAVTRLETKACSKEYTYIVGDLHPLVITYIEWVPANPTTTKPF